MRKIKEYSNRNNNRKKNEEKRRMRRGKNKSCDIVQIKDDKERDKKNWGGGEREGGDKDIHRIQRDSSKSTGVEKVSDKEGKGE